jgi:hypothetical protein
MKTRFVFLIFAALFGVATLAGAATDPAGTPAFMTPACAANASTLQLPDLAPGKAFAAGSVCGTCSDNPCKNQNVATTCFISNRRGSCQPPDSNYCPGTTTWQCQCYVGPL